MAGHYRTRASGRTRQVPNRPRQPRIPLRLRPVAPRRDGGGAGAGGPGRARRRGDDAGGEAAGRAGGSGHARWVGPVWVAGIAHDGAVTEWEQAGEVQAEEGGERRGRLRRWWDGFDPCSGLGDPCSGCSGLDLPCDLSCDLPCGCDFSLVSLVLVTVPRVRPRDRGRVTVPARVGVAAIRGYQRFVSPRLPVCCRYRPSCSHYGLAAVRRYGLAAGSRLAAARIRRCTREVAPGTRDPLPD